MNPGPSSHKVLANGNTIPVLGLGVFDSPTGIAAQSCLEAFKVGYRHVDTAHMYGNEAQVGEAIARSNLPRDQLFVSTKLYFPPPTATETYEKLLVNIEKIGGSGGYVDMMLIHNANIGPHKRKMLWQEMEKLHFEGRIKNIGVSNYGIGHLEDLRKYATVWPPAVNQLEFHPWLQQREIVEFCQKENIIVEAYCPLVRNKKADDQILKSLSKRYGKTTSQVLVKYSLQKGWIPLPKSDNPERIRQNAEVFDWELSAKDMELLDNVPQEKPLVLAVDNADIDFEWKPVNHPS